MIGELSFLQVVAIGVAAVTAIGFEDFAHVDHMGSPWHWVILELPIANWLITEVY